MIQVHTFSFLVGGLFLIWHSLIAQTPEREALKLVLQWEHQSQFAGYYMALEKGIYDQAGLDVTIIPGGADIDYIQMLRGKSADVCTAMLSTMIRENQKNLDKFLLLKQVLNRSNLAIVAWRKGSSENLKIEKPGDLDQTQMSVWEGFILPYECFFSHQKIHPNLVPQYYSLSLFLNKGVDACSAMIYNEYHRIIQYDIDQKDLTIFKLHEWGINLPEDGIYCLQSTYENRREALDRFAQTSMQGWLYAKEHPQETLDIVMQYVEESKLPTNRAHMQWMLNVILDSIFPKNKGQWTPGALSRKSYRKSIEILQTQLSFYPYDEFVTEGARHGLLF